jgi:hypothetical protein
MKKFSSFNRLTDRLAISRQEFDLLHSSPPGAQNNGFA